MLVDLVCHYWKNDPSLPFRVKLHDSPLRHLMADAAEAYRVYELMSLRRPGDVWKYIWVELLDVPPNVHSSRSWRASEAKDSRKWPENWLPLTEFDRCFYWAWDDTEPESQCWLPARQGEAFKKWAEELFAEIQAAQLATRQSTDLLIQVELAQMDALCHHEDYAASTPFQLTYPDYESLVKPGFSAAFYDKLGELIALPEVNCFCLIGEDYQAVRLACEQQRRRSITNPLEQAGRWPLCILADRVHGLKEWNVRASVYQEGPPYGFLMVRQGGAILLNSGRLRWLLCTKDEGDFTGYRRTSGDGWCLYQDLSSDEDFSRKSGMWRWMVSNHWKIEV